MWFGLQTVSSLQRCPLFKVSFIERFHRVMPFPSLTPSFSVEPDSSVPHIDTIGECKTKVRVIKDVTKTDSEELTIIQKWLTDKR